MVPNIFIYLDRLPLTANGKIDRRSLPSPEIQQARPQSRYRGPENKRQEQLAKIWQDVLGVEQVGIDHNFFELGGTSVNMVQIHNLLEQEPGFQIAIVDLFEYPTIRTLAEHLQGGAEDFTLEESRQQAASRKAAKHRRRRRR